ncbi:MAG: 3-dehydroquinate synthase [Acidobacteria bacterium]|nr:3-dehydroquinate synthase [Acidobacteriota bacterium]
MTSDFTIPSERGPYPVSVGRGILKELASGVERLAARGDRFAVVSRRVLELHREALSAALEGFELVPLEDGEEQKTLASVEMILAELIRRGARRDSVVVAIGGGMVGDTAGFAASVLFRGVDLVHVPTTLLAQVDSSIGGKVAVNHSLGKNLIGSIWPPRLVLADLDFLATLPESEFLSGMMEALKGGIIGDPELFELARPQARDDAHRLETTIRRAIALKASIVSSDEREGDQRRLLNYGHTIGHGIEAALGYRGLTHGEAIGWGMIGANEIARRRGVLPEKERSRIDEAIRASGIRRPEGADPARVLDALERDKKFTRGQRVMALATRVGKCEIVAGIGEDELRRGIEAALN